MGILTYLGFIQMFSNIKILCRQMNVQTKNVQTNKTSFY